MRDRQKRRWQYYDLAFGPVREERVQLYETIFTANASRSVRDVLELGCGTGRFLVALGTRGYVMTGVDRDTTALELAREKTEKVGVHPRFIEADLGSWEPNDWYDAVIAPNNVLKWLRTHETLRRCITQAALALRAGGVAIFDLTFEERNWRSADWRDDAHLEEHGWVSEFERPGIAGEYRAFYCAPKLDDGTVTLVERFSCQEQGRQVAIEKRSQWLLFSAREFTAWAAETGLLEHAIFYARRGPSATEVSWADLEETGGQCLLVCRRKTVS